jgi:hypothetical protein
MKIKAPRLPAKTIFFRNYKTFDSEKYSFDIGCIPVTVCEIFDDPSDSYWSLQTLLREVMDEHAPLKTAKVRARDTPFMNGELRRATRVKSRLHRKFKKFPSKKNWEKYRAQRNKTAGIRKAAIKD